MVKLADVGADGMTLTAHDKQMLWIPPGFAHGFLVLSETAGSSTRPRITGIRN
jgi:dTDP-4-dehydrorhamnose 3,5-epimerase-like enzyme